MTYCGRISIDLSNGCLFVEAFIKKYQVKKFIAYYETKDKEGDKEVLNNPHIHFMVEYVNPSDGENKQKRSDFMKQWKQYCPHDGVHYYHKKCESIPNALAYTIKDGHEIITINYSNEEIEEAENRVEKFEKDSKKSALMKLNDRFQSYIKDKKLDEEVDSFVLFKKTKLFIFKVYSEEYKMEVSGSRVNALSIQLIIINKLLTDLDLCDIM